MRSLRLSPSYPLAGLIVAAHSCAAAAVALALPGWPGGLLAAALAALGLASAWSRALLRSPRSARVVHLGRDGAAVELAGGDSLQVDGGGHVSRFMVTLAARHSRRHLLVSADMLDADSFRALRIWARWQKLPGVAGKQLAA